MNHWLDQPAITDWDDAYSNRDHVGNADEYITAWPAKAQDFRSTSISKIDVTYGKGERQRMDLFMPNGSPMGLFVFIHGGYWMRFDKSLWSHLAAGAVANKWGVAIPSYSLCPDVRIRDITKEISAAIEKAANETSGPIVLCGHSAGGHLVTRQVCEDTRLSKKTLARISRVISISGVHDLRPLLRLELNQTLALDEAESQLESPCLLQPVGDMAVDCLVGGDELPEFIRQNDLLANIWRGFGIETSVHHLAGRHHFDVIDDLVDKNGLVVSLANKAFS